MPPQSSELDADVIVIGAGPVGTALATELGCRGVRTLVLEAGDGSVEFPAGEAIFSRTMEHLRRWGIAEEARSVGEPPADYTHRIVFMTRVVGHLLAAFDNGATNRSPGDFAAVSPEGPAFLSKFTFLPLLQRAAAAQASVEIAYEREVVALVQDDSAVTVDVRDTAGGEVRQLRARYLVGCDGGRSWVRRELGIEVAGDFAQGRNFAVHFRAPQLRGLLEQHAGGTAAQIQTLANESRPYITVVNGLDEWRLSVYLDREPEAAEAIGWVHAAVGAPVDVEIIRAQPWSGHRVVAGRYRSGRVFLAGDAAHLLWPKGGFGANTGIGDAVDLGWKLAAALDGWAGPGLLDSYEAERRPIAVRNVAAAASNWGSDAQIIPDPTLDREDQVGADAREKMGERIRRLRGREFLSVGVQLGYRYAGSPIVVPDGSLEPPDEPDVYEPSTWPGSRAPHAWTAPGVSVLDLFGDGFVLVDTTINAGGDDNRWACWSTAARQRGIPFQAVALTGADVLQAYGVAQVLVRPDGHVAWRGQPPKSSMDAAALLGVTAGSLPDAARQDGRDTPQ